MDRCRYKLPCKARTLYAGSLPNIRKTLRIRNVLFAVVLAMLILIGMFTHDRRMALDRMERLVKEQVVMIDGGLIWIQEPEETWRPK